MLKSLDGIFLRVEGLSFRYAKSTAFVLQDFSMTMVEGEMLGMAGASGCGKTTLLRLIAGLERPLRGKIQIDGWIVADRDRFIPPESRRVGMLFQDYGLFPHMTVANNIAFGLHRLTRTERKQCVSEMLELIRMPELAQRYPYELSGGQQQRVALARALAPRPKLLLLDEPFSNLDANLRASIRKEVRDILSTSGTTCLLVSHDQDDLEAVCGRIMPQ